MHCEPWKAILWDVDGTLIETTALIVSCLDQTFREFLGRSLPLTELRALIGTPLDEQILALGDPRQHNVNPDDMVAAFIRRYEQGRDQEHIIDEAVAALLECKRLGIATALVTSKNDSELANTLPRMGITAYCDAIVGADQVAPDFKPHPRSVLMALHLLGDIDPTAAVFIGDSVHDIRAGRAAGVATAAVTWGAGTEASLRGENPDYVIDRPDRLVAVLAGERLPAAIS